MTLIGIDFDLGVIVHFQFGQIAIHQSKFRLKI